MLPIVLQILGCFGVFKVGLGTTAGVIQSLIIVFGATAFCWWLSDVILFSKSRKVHKMKHNHGKHDVYLF